MISNFLNINNNNLKNRFYICYRPHCFPRYWHRLSKNTYRSTTSVYPLDGQSARSVKVFRRMKRFAVKIGSNSFRCQKMVRYSLWSACQNLCNFILVSLYFEGFEPLVNWRVSVTSSPAHVTILLTLCPQVVFIYLILLSQLLTCFLIFSHFI